MARLPIAELMRLTDHKVLCPFRLMGNRKKAWKEVVCTQIWIDHDPCLKKLKALKKQMPQNIHVLEVRMLGIDCLDPITQQSKDALCRCYSFHISVLSLALVWVVVVLVERECWRDERKGIRSSRPARSTYFLLYWELPIAENGLQLSNKLKILECIMKLKYFLHCKITGMASPQAYFSCHWLSSLFCN